MGIIRSFLLLGLLLLVDLAIAGDIILWHSLEGPLGEKFKTLITQFNQKTDILQANIKIIPEYKGTYEQTLKMGLSKLGTREAPHILQVFEMGNLVMQAHPGSYVPLDKLTNNKSPLLAKEHFLPAIASFYKSRSGEESLPSLPFSASSVVLFYNKTALTKAGLDPSHPPTTWEEFEAMAQKLKATGAKNILASGWLAGHHIDQVAAWHNEAIATQGNGVDGDHAILTLNKSFFIDHLSKLADWYQMGMFTLDIGPQAEQAFAKGNVVFLTQGANRLSNIERLVANKFEIEVAPFPYWKKNTSGPQNTVAGGASFWALSGHAPEEYAIIQKFFEYLASLEIQAEWHQDTCYMPVVVGVQTLSEKQKFYEQNLKGKAAKIALESFTGKAPKEFSRGILLPEFPRVREIMVQEMKEAIKGNKTPMEALQQIEISGNRIMQQ